MYKLKDEMYIHIHIYRAQRIYLKLIHIDMFKAIIHHHCDSCS